MTKEKLLNLYGGFTWDFGNKFFIETSEGNFVWSDPNYYHGDNTIIPYHGTCRQWFGNNYGRDKGTHKISEYCGYEILYLGDGI